jgi:hypothetical protein
MNDLLLKHIKAYNVSWSSYFWDNYIDNHKEGSTMVEQPTHNPKFKGLNPAIYYQNNTTMYDLLLTCIETYLIQFQYKIP